MNIENLVRSVTNEAMSRENLGEFAKQVEERLNSMNKSNVKEFTIDRFEGNMVVLEDRENKKIININKEKLPKEIKEGTILKYENDKFSIDEDEQKKVENRIQEKMNNVWDN